MAKNKNEIIEDIKTLKQTNPVEYKELKQEFKNTLAYQSTDDEGHSHKEDSFEKDKKEIPIIKESALKGDKWGNSELSYAIENDEIDRIKEIYNVSNEINKSSLFKMIALDMTDKAVQDQYHIELNVASTIYSEAKYQLDLMGEETIELVEAYNFTDNI